jgi:hypothetical protein
MLTICLLRADSTCLSKSSLPSSDQPLRSDLTTMLSHLQGRAQLAPPVAQYPITACVQFAKPDSWAAFRANGARCRRLTRIATKAMAQSDQRVPHSGYHFDGSPRRCGWPAHRASSLPYYAVCMEWKLKFAGTPSEGAQRYGRHHACTSIATALGCMHLTGSKFRRLLLLVCLQFLKVGTSRSPCPAMARALR